MIKVIITSKSCKGQFPYRIEGASTRQAPAYRGFSPAPLLDACRALKRMGEPGKPKSPYSARQA